MTAAHIPAAGDGGTAPIGILGGTFDPVHNGHLRAALEVLERCRLARMSLVPAGSPPHRAAPVASAELRLRMLRAAVADEPRLVVDDREIRRRGPSYTVDTLAVSARRESVHGRCASCSAPTRSSRCRPGIAGASSAASRI